MLAWIGLQFGNRDVIDYGDILYMHSDLSSLKILDPVYRAALRFVLNSAAWMRKLNGRLVSVRLLCVPQVIRRSALLLFQSFQQPCDLFLPVVSVL